MPVEKESLFSLEVAVKTIYLKQAIVCRVPKVSVRMLDYPSLELSLLDDEELVRIKGILEKQPEVLTQSPQILQLQHSTGTYAFTQGKSMLIKIKLSRLEEQLLNIPVYVMILDVLSDLPKLVASFALSLENSIRKIVQSISLHGIETPCAQGERDVFPLYNLMGSKVGEAEMGVRLSSLGISMLDHVTNIANPESHRIVPFPMYPDPKSSTTSDKTDAVLSTKSTNEKVPPFKETYSLKDVESEDKENFRENKSAMLSGFTQTRPTKPQKFSKSVQYPSDEDAISKENTYCPPALFYDNRSDSVEKDLQLKQHLLNSKAHQNCDESITLADLEDNSTKKHFLSRKSASHPKGQQNREDVSTSQQETEPVLDIPSTLSNFPILRALVEEVTRLGLKDQNVSPRKPASTALKVQKKHRTIKKEPQKLIPRQRPSSKPTDPKGPLKFGLTNTMRLRMAMNKDRKVKQEMSIRKEQHSRDSLTRSRKYNETLGRTYTVKTPRGMKQKKLVSTACGPDVSMYRRVTNVQPQTVYLGKMGGYEDGTDLDVPSFDHMTPEAVSQQVDDDYIEDLMIVKDIATPRVHSRQSQRSIEIHLPTASTEFTIGKDDDPDWASTFSDKERLLEKHRQKEVSDEDDPGFYTPAKSNEASEVESMVKIPAKKVTISQSLEKSDIGSDMYKYSDDFEDDKTWSTNRTPAVTPSASSIILKEGVKESTSNLSENIEPQKSVESLVTTSFTSSVENRAHVDKNHAPRSASTPDETADTSTASNGSVMTTLDAKPNEDEKRTIRFGKKSIPEPIPSASPIIQSIDTEHGESTSFPKPHKVSLTGKLPEKTHKVEEKIKLPESSKDQKTTMYPKSDPPPPKPSRFTPSPPTSRRYSPISSPESSKERMKRIYRHPGRRHRHTSSGSLSSDFDKPPSPVRRSDSVSSYLPSDISEISNIRMSEDLSDIPSEDSDSQDESRSIKRQDYMPHDGPKTYFGVPKLDPSHKLGYTK